MLNLIKSLDLPRVAQSYDFTCGAACFSSMFQYFKQSSPGEMYFAKELGTLDLGYTPPLNIVTLARYYEFSCDIKNNAEISDLIKILSKGEVAFVTWWDTDAGHYSLVKHLDQQHIILMDPWLAREQLDNRLTISDFIPKWNLRGSIVIRVSAI